MNFYRFTHPTANACLITARTSAEAWRKLQRTHAYYFARDDKWKRVIAKTERTP